MTGEVTREEMVAALRRIISNERDNRADWPPGSTMPEADLYALEAVLRELEAGGWRPISDASQELRERAAYMRGKPGAYRMQLCQLTHECCWAVWLGPSAGDSVTHYFTRPLRDCDEPSPPTTSDGTDK